jgi:hypothetical protein
MSPRRVCFGIALALAAASTAQAQTSHLGDVLNWHDLVAEQAPPPPPQDARFFGDYCLAAPKQFCKSVFLLPDPCVTLSKVRAHVDHLVLVNGGTVRGSGTLTIGGKEGVLALSGSVRRRGRVRMVAVVPGLGQQRADATLSADGLALSTSVQNRSLTLRKDACGNNAPAVTLQAPTGPVPFAQSIMLSGTVTDEDPIASFPVERMVFTSNIQGKLSGWRPTPRTLATSTLFPGNHRITLTVTDSGGLTGTAQADVTIVNRPPATPIIYLPTEGANLVAGGETLLKGTALDPDTGVLGGSSLLWSAQLTPGGAFVPLGTGSERPATFATAADPVRVRLTATDSSGTSATAERTVHVAANTGNTPPVVVINVPDRNELSGPVAAGYPGGTPVSFLATAWDSETLPADLQVRWQFQALASLDGPVDSAPPLPNPADVTQTLAPSVSFPAVTDRYYRVTVTATDAAGLKSTDSVVIRITTLVIL